MLKSAFSPVHVTELYQEKFELEVKNISIWNLKALLSGQLIQEMRSIWSRRLKYVLLIRDLNSYVGHRWQCDCISKYRSFFMRELDRKEYQNQSPIQRCCESNFIMDCSNLNRLRLYVSRMRMSPVTVCTIKLAKYWKWYKEICLNEYFHNTVTFLSIYIKMQMSHQYWEAISKGHFFYVTVKDQGNN